jgi:excisionase family DNA binding protein
MKTDELIAGDAARTLGVGRLYLYELLASGRIKGRKVLGRWLIPRPAIDTYRREHPRTGGVRCEARNG